MSFKYSSNKDLPKVGKISGLSIFKKAETPKTRTKITFNKPKKAKKIVKRKVKSDKMKSVKIDSQLENEAKNYREYQKKHKLKLLEQASEDNSLMFCSSTDLRKQVIIETIEQTPIFKEDSRKSLSTIKDGSGANISIGIDFNSFKKSTVNIKELVDISQDLEAFSKAADYSSDLDKTEREHADLFTC